MAATPHAVANWKGVRLEGAALDKFYPSRPSPSIHNKMNKSGVSKKGGKVQLTYKKVTGLAPMIEDRSIVLEYADMDE